LRFQIVTAKTDKGKVEFDTRRAEGFTHAQPLRMGGTNSGFPKVYKNLGELPFAGKNINPSAVKASGQSYIESPIHPSEKGGEPHPVNTNRDDAPPGAFRTVSTYPSRDFGGIMYHPTQTSTIFKKAHHD
jgi:hypothetical protein